MLLLLRSNLVRFVRWPTTSGTEVRVLLHAFRCVTYQQQQHSYTATTSGTEVRVLLHAFRCVTYQQQQHSYIHSHHIRHRGQSVVARLQVRHLSTATAFIQTQPPHPAQRWECCCTPSGASPTNSNSIHSYAATTTGREVRVLLHAFRCVTYQQQ
jgi:hypothetical protein